MDACPVAPETFTRLVNLVSRKALTEQAARKVLEEVFRTGKDPEAVVEEKGLRSIQDEGVLEDIVAQVMEEHVEVVKKIQAGQQEPIHFLVGQVMKKTSGRANAGMVREILSRKLGLEA
jgi:aspartyl-tRNA(Asn)/glutamyl-tRNA(Gln) amidotransferase subunit B